MRPQKMIGHSIGEFVAACLAGVFSLADALHILAVRGRLMQSLPSGSMLAVSASEEELVPWLTGGLSMAAVNAPKNCVISGPTAEVEVLEGQLTEREIGCRYLHTSHAFHSSMMDPILDEFTAEVSRIRLSPPTIPFLSSPSGTWITEQEALSPAYWASHLRRTVRFGDGRKQLASEEKLVFVRGGTRKHVERLGEAVSSRCYTTGGAVVTWARVGSARR